MCFLFINKPLRLNKIKTGTAMNTKNSVLFMLKWSYIFYLHDCTFKYVGRFQYSLHVFQKFSWTKSRGSMHWQVNRWVEEDKLIFEIYLCQDFNRLEIRRREQKRRLLFGDLLCRDEICIIYRTCKNYWLYKIMKWELLIFCTFN